MSEPHTKFPHLVDALGSTGVYQNLEIHCLKQKLLLWYVHHWEQIHFICVPHSPPTRSHCSCTHYSRTVCAGYSTFQPSNEETQIILWGSG